MMDKLHETMIFAREPARSIAERLELPLEDASDDLGRIEFVRVPVKIGDLSMLEFFNHASNGKRVEWSHILADAPHDLTALALALAQLGFDAEAIDAAEDSSGRKPIDLPFFQEVVSRLRMTDLRRRLNWSRARTIAHSAHARPVRNYRPRVSIVDVYFNIRKIEKMEVSQKRKMGLLRQIGRNDAIPTIRGFATLHRIRA